MRRKDKSTLPILAGILMIVAFILAILTASGIYFLDLDTIEIEGELEQEFDQDFLKSIFNFCGVFILIISVFLLLGGIFAVKKSHWNISIIGAVLGIFTIGPFFLGSIISFAAIVLLLLSKSEFKDKSEEGKSLGETSFDKAPMQYLEEPKEESACPDCGEPMLKDKEYDTFYCINCGEYK